MKRRQLPNLEMLFDRLDKNTDGVLSVDEIPDRIKRRLASVDLDENGSISKEEMVQAIQKLRSRMQRGMQLNPMKNGPEGESFGKGRGKRKLTGEDISPESLMRRLDKNRDGQLTTSELPERMREKFSDVDKDGNEILNERELVSMVERIKAKMQGGARYQTDPEKTKAKMPKRPGTGK